MKTTLNPGEYSISKNIIPAATAANCLADFHSNGDGTVTMTMNLVVTFTPSQMADQTIVNIQDKYCGVFVDRPYELSVSDLHTEFNGQVVKIAVRSECDAIKGRYAG